MNNIQYYTHLCLCGCGGQIEIKKHHKYYGIPKYVHGHSGRNKYPTEEKVAYYQKKQDKK